MPQPSYNPWGTPIFPNTGSAFGVGSPAEAAERQPTFVDSLLSHIAGALGRGFMAPGQALQSTEPVTTEQMIKPAADIAGSMTLGAGAIPADLNALRMGIKAYHGSPHDFDRFDISKIGTGEGAQAYGHGLYFAENEGVAKSYRDALASNTPLVGKTAADPSNPEHVAAAFLSQYKTPQAALKELDDTISWAATNPQFAPPKEHLLAAQKAKDLIASGHPLPTSQANPGKMYEVNLNADPAHLLDWDKKVREMPPLVQERLAQAGLSQPHGGQIGSQVYHATADASGAPVTWNDKGAVFAADRLREAGIPGIKYLDQGSRSSGQGSSNYVMFDDKLIDILRKYGIAGMTAPPIFAAAMSEQKQ